MKIHQRINPNCKFLRKSEEVNVPAQFFGPYCKDLMAIIDIPAPTERTEQSEDVNNDWAPERIRSQAPSQSNVKSVEKKDFIGSFKNLNYKIKAGKEKKKADCTYNEEQFERIIAVRNYTWLPLNELPVPEVDLTVAFVPQFEPLLSIIDQIAMGTPPTPHISMRYELLRFCTLRNYPKENKPYLIKLAQAGFYYASDGDGVVCYCCGVRRYNWVAEDIPMKIHQRINPNCKFLRKNEEVNVPVQCFGPYNKASMAIMDIPEPIERTKQSEGVNNDWAPTQQNKKIETGAKAIGINSTMPKHTHYATKTAREGSYSGWPDTARHNPQELSDAGFFYAGFGDCVRCFYCGKGLRNWGKDDNPWIEHARWSRNCFFVKVKKGKNFVNLVQLAVQNSKYIEAQSNSSAGNQLPVQEIERILLSDAAQSVLEMGYQPRIIKEASEQIFRQNGKAKITVQILLEKILEIEEIEKPPLATPSPPSIAVRTHTMEPLHKTASSEATKASDCIASISDERKTNIKDAKASVNTKGEKKSSAYNISEKEVPNGSFEDPIEWTWITDEEINRAQTLLKAQFPRVNGLQDTILSELYPFHSHKKEFVQIYNANKNHWVVISSIGQKSGTVAVYDSLNREISQDTSMVISQLTNLQSAHVIMPAIQKQINLSDCGLHAIAITTAILNGVDVSSLNLDPEQLRLHLAMCFSRNRMELFPEIKIPLARLPEAAFQI